MVRLRQFLIHMRWWWISCPIFEALDPDRDWHFYVGPAGGDDSEFYCIVCRINQAEEEASDG